MNTNTDSTSRIETLPIRPVRELFEIVRRNKSWTALAVMCTADGVFAIINLSTRIGFLTTCSSATDLKTCQLNFLGIAHVLGWTLVPPVFFFMETMIKRSSFELTGEVMEDARRKADADRLKAMQEMGGKIWAAVLAAILFLAPK